MRNPHTVAFKNTPQRQPAAVTYVIPGFAERWRERFTPARFRNMGIGASGDPEEMKRIMGISEAMLAELPGRLARLMALNRNGGGGGELEGLLLGDTDKDAELEGENGNYMDTDSDSDSDDDDDSVPTATPFLPWDQATRSVLDSLLDDYQLESLVTRTPLTSSATSVLMLPVVSGSFEETCKSSSSHDAGVIPCASRRTMTHQCVSV